MADKKGGVRKEERWGVERWEVGGWWMGRWGSGEKKKHKKEMC
ncbi:MAG: hypothetical protein ACKERG_02635 [Candidatus Hodgkinia cicadicola]